MRRRRLQLQAAPALLAPACAAPCLLLLNSADLLLLPACPPAARPPADAVVEAAEGEIALAACDSLDWLISGVNDAFFGNVAEKCNSTVAYM